MGEQDCEYPEPGLHLVDDYIHMLHTSHHPQGHNHYGNQNDLYSICAAASNPAYVDQHGASFFPRFPPYDRLDMAAINTSGSSTLHQPQTLPHYRRNHGVQPQQPRLPSHFQTADSTYTSGHVSHASRKGQTTAGEVVYGGVLTTLAVSPVSRVGPDQPPHLNENKCGAVGPLPLTDTGQKFTACMLDTGPHKSATSDRSGPRSQAPCSASPRGNTGSHSKPCRIGLNTLAHRSPGGEGSGDNGGPTAGGGAGVSCGNGGFQKSGLTHHPDNATPYTTHTHERSTHVESATESNARIVHRPTTAVKAGPRPAATTGPHLCTHDNNNGAGHLHGDVDQQNKNNRKLVTKKTANQSIKGSLFSQYSEKMNDVTKNSACVDQVFSDKKSNIKKLDEDDGDGKERGCRGVDVEDVDLGSESSSSCGSEERNPDVKEEDGKGLPVYPWMKSQYGK